MHTFDHIGLAGVYLLGRFVNPVDTFNAGYLLAAMMFAVGAYLWRRRLRSRVSLKALALATKKVLTHRSTLVDYKLYLINGFLAVACYGLAEGTSEGWKAGVLKGLVALGGPAGVVSMPHWSVAVIVTVVQVLMLDLAYWSTHWLFHNVRFFWELHKVHHSAEVMTPFTEWRQHPIEFVLFANALTLSTGVTYGVAAWVFGRGALPFSLLQLNVLLVVHLLTIHHLRHSHAWIAARGWLGRIVHSPAHHQIHHSTDPKHFGHNLGYALSVWDWVFGTLYMPAKVQKVVFGLGEVEDRQFRRARDAFIQPMMRGLKIDRRPKPFASPAQAAPEQA